MNNRGLEYHGTSSYFNSDYCNYQQQFFTEASVKPQGQKLCPTSQHHRKRFEFSTVEICRGFVIFKTTKTRLINF